MKKFVAGVVTTLTGGVLLAWTLESVPSTESARAALANAMEASATVARTASTVMLVVACLCALGCLTYWIRGALGARQGIGIVGGFGVSWLLVGATVTFALGYAGLRYWSAASEAALPVTLGAVAVGAWTVAALRRCWSAMFRIA